MFDLRVWCIFVAHFPKHRKLEKPPIPWATCRYISPQDRGAPFFYLLTKVQERVVDGADVLGVALPPVLGEYCNEPETHVVRGQRLLLPTKGSRYRSAFILLSPLAWKADLSHFHYLWFSSFISITTKMPMTSPRGENQRRWIFFNVKVLNVNVSKRY